eukprot:CAMPEP_0205829126 /NCGR_PEP_ID=MMETSP0206-20130828/37129_1 /ASSEMBLY_ACC=CAM_ASM_000279 /TAXON_ID=36767 /ORGANISM="Euplotes focardii, Strain TN1" /LENGTH=43 /DNA_ID= /DNA_START= /DNA_END= /DNA_ORIENTATION=
MSRNQMAAAAPVVAFATQRITDLRDMTRCISVARKHAKVTELV